MQPNTLCDRGFVFPVVLTRDGNKWHEYDIVCLGLYTVPFPITWCLKPQWKSVTVLVQSKLGISVGMQTMKWLHNCGGN